MKIDFAKAIQIALMGLAVANQVAPQIGSEEHTQAASDAVDAASAVAGQVITDPQQVAEAAAAASAAKSIIGLLALWTTKK